jgi:hypothetical protein
MSRRAFVSSKPITLPPYVPEPGSLDARLAKARKLVLQDAWSPTVRAAALAGSEAETGYEDNPYLPGSVEAAAWLLAWWTRDQDERHR